MKLKKMFLKMKKKLKIIFKLKKKNNNLIKVKFYLYKCT